MTLYKLNKEAALKADLTHIAEGIYRNKPSDIVFPTELRIWSVPIQLVESFEKFTTADRVPALSLNGKKHYRPHLYGAIEPRFVGEDIQEYTLRHFDDVNHCDMASLDGPMCMSVAAWYSFYRFNKSADECIHSAEYTSEREGSISGPLWCEAVLPLFNYLIRPLVYAKCVRDDKFEVPYGINTRTASTIHVLGLEHHLERGAFDDIWRWLGGECLICNNCPSDMPVEARFARYTLSKELTLAYREALHQSRW